MAVTYISGLSTFAKDKLTCRYEQQLGTQHKETCTFRRDALEYFGDEEKEHADDWIIPRVFTTYFPPDLIELAESKRPAIVLAKEVRQQMEGNIAWGTIHLEYHASLLQYQAPAANNATGATDSEMGLGDCLVLALAKAGCRFNNVEKAKTVALILLLGWEPKESGGKDKASISFSCQLCRATADVPCKDEGDDDGDKETDTTEPQAKRSRPSGWDPLYAHRHYCPYVCGFPRKGASRGTPLWKSLADKVLLASSSSSLLSDTIEDETSLPNLKEKSEWEQVNALLNAAIVRARPRVDSN